MRIAKTIGNKELWGREKTLFLTSRMAPVGCYENVFRWVEEFDRGQCAVCFNTSELEEEVLKALLVCHVPTVLVVTGKFRNTYNVQIEQALKEDRLLILVLQREESDGKGFEARLRNQWAIDQVQHIVCGYINPNGSIFGLLAGRNNVTHLVDRKELKAAEQEAKPYRWTVAEDKRLLRMFYEDMGIHAIHKAINRPYSTIYLRIKSLTMNDEVLKGREFEDYVVDFFDLLNSKKLTLKEWRGDKSLPGIYLEGVPPGGRRTLRRHRAQCQTALRGLQETERDVILHRHTKMTKAEASDGLGFLFVLSPHRIHRWYSLVAIHSLNFR